MAPPAKKQKTEFDLGAFYRETIFPGWIQEIDVREMIERAILDRVDGYLNGRELHMSELKDSVKSNMIHVDKLHIGDMQRLADMRDGQDFSELMDCVKSDAHGIDEVVPYVEMDQLKQEIGPGTQTEVQTLAIEWDEQLDGYAEQIVDRHEEKIRDFVSNVKSLFDRFGADLED